MAVTIPLLRTDNATKQAGQWRNYFRMDQELFVLLEEMVSPLITKQDTGMRTAIPPRTKLCLTLRYLATGHTMHELHYDFKLGESRLFVSKIMPSNLIKAYKITVCARGLIFYYTFIITQVYQLFLLLLLKRAEA